MLINGEDDWKAKVNGEFISDYYALGIKLEFSDAKMYIDCIDDYYIVRANNIDLSSLDIIAFLGGSKSRWPDIKEATIKFSGYDIMLHNDKSFVYLDGLLQISNDKLDFAELHGSLDDVSSISLRVTVSDAEIILLVDNFGHLLSAFDITDSIHNGVLELHGKRREFDIRIDDFVLKKVPILARILLLGAFDTAAQMLDVKGLYFHRFSTKMLYGADQIVYIDKSFFDGNLLGISVEGWVDISGNNSNLFGAISPNYIGNRLIHKIPVIGQFIAGGKKEGLIAINYNLKGELDNPVITVNPLSMLTPGFLRSIFRIG